MKRISLNLGNSYYLMYHISFDIYIYISSYIVSLKEHDMIYNYIIICFGRSHCSCSHKSSKHLKTVSAITQITVDHMQRNLLMCTCLIVAVVLIIFILVLPNIWSFPFLATCPTNGCRYVWLKYSSLLVARNSASFTLW